LFYSTLTEKKNGSHVFASSLTASNTKHVNLTWLPLETMHRGHTWHDYPWPWVSSTWLLYNPRRWRHRHWFWKFTVHFWPIRKEIVSSMYNNYSYKSDVLWRITPLTSVSNWTAFRCFWFLGSNFDDHYWSFVKRDSCSLVQCMNSFWFASFLIQVSLSSLNEVCDKHFVYIHVCMLAGVILSFVVWCHQIRLGF